MPQTYTVTAQDPKTGKEFDVDIEWNGAGEPDPAAVQTAVHSALANMGHVEPPAPVIPERDVRNPGQQAGAAAAGFGSGFLHAAIPNPIEMVKNQLGAVRAPVDQLLGNAPGMATATMGAGVPGVGVLDKIGGALQLMNPLALAGQADPTGTIRGLLQGAGEGGQQAVAGVQAGDPRAAGAGVGKAAGTVLPALVGEGTPRVPGVGRLAAPVEAAGASTLQSLIGKLKTRAAGPAVESAKSASPGTAPAASQAGEGVGAAEPLGPPSIPRVPAPPEPPSKLQVKTAKEEIGARLDTQLKAHVDQFLDDVAKGSGSLEDAGKSRGEALAAKEQALRDEFKTAYSDVHDLADEAGVRAKTDKLTEFVAGLPEPDRAKLKNLGVQLVEQEVGDAVVEPPTDLSFREMHDLRSRALRAVRTLKSGPPDPATGAARKVAALAGEALDSAAASSPELADTWRHVDQQYRKTFGSKGEFYGTVLKKIAKTALDTGVPPEKSHRLLFGASLEDVRALKEHLPEADVRRMFRDALEEKLTNPDGTIVDPDKIVNTLRSPKVFGRDLLREGLGERHEAALDRLVTTLKSKKVDANQAEALLQERAVQLRREAKAHTTDERTRFAQAQKSAAQRAADAEAAAKEDARNQSLQSKIEAEAEKTRQKSTEDAKKLGQDVAFATLGIGKGPKLLFRVMAHPKTAYALAKVLEEGKAGTLSTAGIWSSRLNDGMREVLKAQQGEDARKEKGPSR